MHVGTVHSFSWLYSIPFQEYPFISSGNGRHLASSVKKCVAMNMSYSIPLIPKLKESL